MSRSEYYAKSSAGPVCSYANLNHYQKGQTYVPTPENTPSMAVQIVPAFEPIKYDTLQHGMKYSCGGYFGIKGAYPDAQNGSCHQQFVRRPCGGLLK
jgi:hypothetical protein